MAKPKYRAMVALGTYTADSGEEKTIWRPVGAVFEGPKGMGLKLDMMPIGAFGGGAGHPGDPWDGWIRLFRNDEEEGEGRPRGGSSRKPPEDDIPF